MRTPEHALVALVMAKSGLARHESRGSHYRSDFPYRDDDNFAKHSVAKKEKESLRGLKPHLGAAIQGSAPSRDCQLPWIDELLDAFQENVPGNGYALSTDFVERILHRVPIRNLEIDHVHRGHARFRNMMWSSSVGKDSFTKTFGSQAAPRLSKSNRERLSRISFAA